jgi:hypothetical protein
MIAKIVTPGVLAAISITLAAPAQADPDYPGWLEKMDFNGVTQAAKAAGITADTISVEVVIEDFCYWLHGGSFEGVSTTDSIVAQSITSELGQITSAQTYAVGLMSTKYLCPPERPKLEGYLSASRNPSTHEWMEDGKPYREWLVPADLINTRATVTLLSDDELDRMGVPIWRGMDDTPPWADESDEL